MAQSRENLGTKGIYTYLIFKSCCDSTLILFKNSLVSSGHTYDYTGVLYNGQGGTLIPGTCYEVSTAIALDVNFFNAIPNAQASDNTFFILKGTACRDAVTCECPEVVCGECPDGFTEVNGRCEHTETVQAHFTGTTYNIVKGNQNSSYGAFGLKLYPDITGMTYPLYGKPTGSGYHDYHVHQGDGTPMIITPTTSDNYLVVTNAGLGPEVIATTEPLLTGGVQSALWGVDQYPNTSPLYDCYLDHLYNNTGRLNQASIWAKDNAGNIYPANVPFSLSYCIDISETKQYLIGIAGDNYVKIAIDGVDVVYLDVNLQDCSGGSTPITVPPTTPCYDGQLWNHTFKFWHVFPITLSATTVGNPHVITVSGLNLGGAYAFAAEIYQVPLAYFTANLMFPAVGSGNCGNVFADLEPYIVFTTSNPDLIGTQIGDPYGTWSCPSGGVGTISPCGSAPECTSTTYVDIPPCCYKLTNCLDETDVIHTGVDLSTYIGDVVTLQPSYGIDTNTCWRVDVEVCCGINTIVTVKDGYPDCISCTRQNYLLIDCEDPTNTVLTYTDLSEYVNHTIHLPNRIPRVQDDTCWQVTLTNLHIDSVLVNTTELREYNLCICCTNTIYLLHDCSKPIEDTFTDLVTFTDFSLYTDKTIQFDNQFICWSVSETNICENVIDLCGLGFSAFDDCPTCRNLPQPSTIPNNIRSVKPGYNTPGCDPEYTEKINCKFANAIYNQMSVVRYGVKMCCDLEVDKWSIKKSLLDMKAIYDPGACCPIVEPCCPECPPTN